MPLITQRQAIKSLREATGLSIETCKAIVKAMPQKEDGKRMKIRSFDLTRRIAEENAPAPAKNIGIRPLSAKHRAEARADAETRRIVNRLQNRIVF